MSRSFIIISLLVISVSTFAQKRGKKNYMNSRQTKTVFPDPFEYEINGWFLAPGITYTATLPGKQEKEINAVPTTIENKGKFRFYIGGGRYRFLEYWYLFKYMDYGLGYKWLAGEESTNPGSTNSFSDHHATAFINFNNIIDVSDIGFLQNTIGGNVDYQFIQNRTGVGPDNLIAQLHYKLGFGWKPTKKLLIIPAVEVPIVSFLPRLPNPTLNYFNSEFEPLIISLRFLFLRPKRDFCPPVYNPAMPTTTPADGVSE